MIPAADPQLSKMHQRAQLRMLQAFQFYIVQIAQGAKPKEAIDHIDEAMDAWTDYQDRYEEEHRLPELPDQIGSMMAAFQEMAKKFQREPEEDALIEPVTADPTPWQFSVIERQGQKLIQLTLPTPAQIIWLDAGHAIQYARQLESAGYHILATDPASAASVPPLTTEQNPATNTANQQKGSL